MDKKICIYGGSRGGEAVALTASVHIEAGLNHGRTVLRRSFFQPPFKLADITEDRNQKELRLMLMSSSPGVLDGDVYDMSIEVAEGSALHLSTQSYQRIFQMKGSALQRITARLQCGSSFSYLPHPVVPHQASTFKSINRIYVEEDASLLWGEVLSGGRVGNGEAFQFSSYQNLTEIFLNDRLVVKENLVLKPGVMNVKGIGQFEGYTHTASLLFVNATRRLNGLQDELKGPMQAYPAIAFGISALPVAGFAVRMLGCKAEELFTAIQGLARHIQLFIHQPALADAS